MKFLAKSEPGGYPPGTNPTRILAPLCPILPASRDILSNPDCQKAVDAITEQLTTFTLSYNEMALSLGVRSIHNSLLIFSFHNTPPIFNASGVHKVDGDTVYRIGSITKFFTALPVLQLEGKFKPSESATEYVPDVLDVKVTGTCFPSVDWSTITVESLLSQLSGI